MPSHPVNLDTISNRDLAYLYTEVVGEMQDRKITKDMAWVLVQDPELINKCVDLLDQGESFAHGIVEVSIERPDQHPSYIRVTSLDSGHQLRLLLLRDYSNPIELAEVIQKTNKEELDEL